MSAYRELIIKSTATGSSDVVVPVHVSAAGLTQSYTELVAQTLYRKMDGSAAVRRAWRGKIRTEISGRGLVPHGLQALCTATGTVTVSCIGHRSVRSASNVITIPAARRTDSGSTWYARKWNNDVWTTASGTSTTGAPNVVTITLASGETNEGYEVCFFPKITGYPTLSEESYTQNDGFSWSLTVEEA
jgi:hypothetical protein